MKTGRNQPCPCRSGQKYKRCCGRIRPAAIRARPDVAWAARLREVAEQIRRQQQGLGRPIISATVADHRIVIAGDEMHWSKQWKTFPDFLMHYLKTKLGIEWGKAEEAKPYEQQHPILQWLRCLSDYLQRLGDRQGEIRGATGIGVVWCILGLAYNLYLIKHNVELQDRLLVRLRDPQQFQGAYYELIVANLLIRAGFDLELEDEQDNNVGHCEFAARHRDTGRLFSVEAKTRSVAGIFGKSAWDGGKDNDPTRKVTDHLREALKKPAAGERLVFIDINAEGIREAGEPAWGSRVYEKLLKSEQSRAGGPTAYVFVTNMNYHRHLDDERADGAALAFGYGIADFGKNDQISLPEAYRRKQKYKVAYDILDRVASYTKLPMTFDGSLLSENPATESRRIIVGERYIFDDPIGVAEVTSATAIIAERKKYVGVSTPDNKAFILCDDMSDAEIDDYSRHGDAIFGELRNTTDRVNSAFEAFEWLMGIYAEYTEAHLLKQIEGAPDIEAFKALPRDELMLAVAERVASAMARNFKKEA